MLEKVQEDRQKKLQQIRELGVDPYGWRYDDVELIDSILARYEDPAEGEESSQAARAAGRLILIRDMGKMIFAHIRDSSGQMQIALRKDVMDEAGWKLGKLLDLGDIVGVAGLLQRTRTGEITIWADELKMLTKSLLPMPEKFHGLQDVEMRYRQRYLDLMTNPESMANFRTRIEIVELIRRELKKRRYSEVETPMMQAIYGGAAARPFTTHNNSLDCDMFLRISPELYLKRLLVGGMERVFEINRNFRNEGLSTRHNPEFTMMELYEAYADYNVMMEIAEELFINSASEICVPALIAKRDARKAEIEQMRAEAERQLKNKRSPKTAEEKQADYEAALAAYEQARADAPKTPLFKAAEACETTEGSEPSELVLPYGDELINYKKPWRRAKYADLFAEHVAIEMSNISAVREKARQLGIKEEKLADSVVVNEIFEEIVEPHLVQPTFVCDYPAELCPLTRRDPDNPDIALRFELFIAKMEIANAYTELNDPAIQKENLSAQLKGEEEETMRVMDDDFITALQHGMPPAGGMGIGIDRMVMLLSDTQSIRDVILFPMLKPEVKE